MDTQNQLTLLQLKATLPSEAASPVLLYKIEIPQLYTDTSFNKFYSKICNKCESFCQNSLLEWCKGSQKAQSDHVYSYSIRCKAIANESDITVTLYISLSDKTAGKVISSCKQTHFWVKKGKHFLLYNRLPHKKNAHL